MSASTVSVKPGRASLSLRACQNVADTSRTSAKKRLRTVVSPVGACSRISSAMAPASDPATSTSRLGAGPAGTAEWQAAAGSTVPSVPVLLPLSFTPLTPSHPRTPFTRLPVSIQKDRRTRSGLRSCGRDDWPKEAR